MSKAFWFGLAMLVSPVVARAQTAAVNPAYQRAQAMVNDGNAAAGRALVDSMIAVAAPGSNDYAEGVYWRAVLAATAVDAEMDYRRIVVDYPASPRVEDALIRLAQLEMARANYDAALRHLNRLAAEHPNSPARGRAGYWMARALFDKNDIQGGCAATTDALARTSESDTELRNQITYLNQRCANLPASTPTQAQTQAQTSVPAPISTAPPAAIPSPPAPEPAPVTTVPVDSTAARPAIRPAATTEKPALPVATPAPVKSAPKESSSSGERVFSVQVAAYNAKAQAEAMASKLKKRGYEARVDGTVAPFRVRIGKYATQAQASAVQRSLKAKQITGIVVQADIR